MNIQTLWSSALRLAFIPLVALVVSAPSLSAAVSTWTAAGATSNFSDALNWDAFPTPDGDLVFPAGSAYASKGSPVNDMTGLTVNALNIYEAYHITGNAITCKIINDVNATTATVALPLQTAGTAVLTVTVTTFGATLNLSGILSGDGPVTYGGPGIKQLNGVANNTISGLSTVSMGTLSLNSAGARAIAGPLVIDVDAIVALKAGPNIGNTVVVTVNGTLDVSTATGSEGVDTETIGGLLGNGIVNLGSKTLGCSAQVTPTDFAGGFTGTGGFRQSISGEQILSGNASTTTGAMTLAGGSLHIHGSQASAPVVVTAGALVLANDSMVGPVTISGGSLSSLAFGSTSVAMHGTATSLTMGSGCIFRVGTRSPTECGYLTAGDAAITGATMTVDTSLYTPVVGAVLTIIDNTGTHAVTGVFSGLAEGATVTSSANSGTTFRISYIGGTGNDVTLTGVTVAVDTTVPVIAGTTSGSITATSAAITWTTNEASDSQVEYGMSTAYGSTTTLATALGTSHTATITALAAGTTYHYRVHSTDAAGNLALGADTTFTTLASPVVVGSPVTITSASSHKDKSNCGSGSGIAFVMAGLMLAGWRLGTSRRG